MWKKIFKVINEIFNFLDPNTKHYLDNLADKNNSEPVFKLKDENESRFSDLHNKNESEK